MTHSLPVKFRPIFALDCGRRLMAGGAAGSLMKPIVIMKVRE
jgi:hypothetical protein